jgi:hypothetical protein
MRPSDVVVEYIDTHVIGIFEKFFEDHCAHFEDVDENKLIYTELYEQFKTILEDNLEKCLRDNSMTRTDLMDDIDDLNHEQG